MTRPAEIAVGEGHPGEIDIAEGGTGEIDVGSHREASSVTSRTARARVASVIRASERSTSLSSEPERVHVPEKGRGRHGAAFECLLESWGMGSSWGGIAISSCQRPPAGFVRCLAKLARFQVASLPTWR